MKKTVKIEKILKRMDNYTDVDTIVYFINDYKSFFLGLFVCFCVGLFRYFCILGDLSEEIKFLKIERGESKVEFDNLVCSNRELMVEFDKLVNGNKDLSVEKYRSYDQIIELYERISVLNEKNQELAITVNNLEAYKTRQSSLRKNTIQKNYDTLHDNYEDLKRQSAVNMDNDSAFDKNVWDRALNDEDRTQSSRIKRVKKSPLNVTK